MSCSQYPPTQHRKGTYYESHKARLQHLEGIMISQSEWGNRILDVGCADRLKVFRGREITSIDMNKGYRPDAVADACSLPFKDNAFDMVICSQTIEHIEYPEQALKEMRRVSRGKILIETVNVASLKNRVKLLLGKSILSPKLNNPLDEHKREYTMKELMSLVDGMDMRIYGHSCSDRGSWKTKLLNRISGLLPITWKMCIGVIAE